MNLEFKVLEKDVVAFSVGVLEAVEALGYTYDFDETSPPNEDGETTYKLINVRKENEV